MARFLIEKFDVVVMNPPYNSPSSNKGSAHVLWDKFVIKVIEKSLVEDGYLVAVHPDGWRSVGTGFKEVKNIIKSKQILYLEVHDRSDGVDMFSVQTAFDFYCLKNKPNPGNFITKIRCIDNTIERVNISNLPFIPNGMFTEFNKIIAKSNDDKIEILYNCNYHIQKEFVKDVKDASFKYPCVYTILKNGTMNLKYSNINSKGHFGISKVIWTNGTSKPFIDLYGDYGMCQFAYAVVDKTDNLKNIQKAMLNPKFLKLMEYSQGVKHRYNKDVIKLFRKDFWVDFLDYNNDD